MLKYGYPITTAPQKTVKIEYVDLLRNYPENLETGKPFPILISL